MTRAPYSMTFTPRRQKSGYTALKVYLAGAAVQLVVMGLLFWKDSYVHDMRMYEARLTLGDIGKAAQASFARDGKLCPSATKSVPEDFSALPGRHRSVSDGYQSQHSEWTVDEASHRGFACLGFEMTKMHHFGYAYEATPTSFVARATGDPEYTGDPVTFELRGVVKNGVLQIASEPKESKSRSPLR